MASGMRQLVVFDAGSVILGNVELRGGSVGLHRKVRRDAPYVLINLINPQPILQFIELRDVFVAR